MDELIDQTLHKNRKIKIRLFRKPGKDIGIRNIVLM